LDTILLNGNNVAIVRHAQLSRLRRSLTRPPPSNQLVPGGLPEEEPAASEEQER
jgi:hypothetical protein